MNLPATETTKTPIVITQYEKLTTDIALHVEADKKLSADYAKPADNALVRSHIYKMRLTRGAIDRARKEAKAQALDYGRRVDALAAELEAKIDALIAPHQAALDQIEKDEMWRVAKHKEAVARIVALREMAFNKDSKTVLGLFEMANEIDTSALQEYKEQADTELINTREALTLELKRATQMETERAELDRLRADEAKRLESERIESIQRHAVEIERLRIEKVQEERNAAIMAAQEKQDREAKAAIVAAEKRELEAKLQTERAQREREDADKRAAAAELRAKHMQEEREQAAKVAEENRLRRVKAEEENKTAMIAILVGRFAGRENHEIACMIVAGEVPQLSVNW